MKGLSTRPQAVKALGLPSPRALDRLIEKGAPPPAPGKRGTNRYDVPAIEAWIAERKVRLKPGLDLSAERAKLARVQRLLTRLKFREAKGDLLRREEVERIQTSIAGAVRAQLQAVPRRCVLGGLPVEFEPIVKKLITEALRELSEVRKVEALPKEETD